MYTSLAIPTPPATCNIPELIDVELVVELMLIVPVFDTLNNS